MAATDEMISLAISLHLFFIVAIILVDIRLYLLFRSDREFVPLSHIYDRWVLYHRALLGSLAFAGVVVMAVMHFEVRWQVWLMVLLSLHMLATTIKEYIYYKPTSKRATATNELFIKKAKKKYLIELVLLILVSIISYAVSL